MSYYCPTCNEYRHIDEVEEVEPLETNHPDSPIKSTNYLVCLDCGETVEECDPFEGMTLEEYQD
jgi:DNA-directed RNA polymerase subunit RPC12/RpoP